MTCLAKPLSKDQETRALIVGALVLHPAVSINTVAKTVEACGIGHLRFHRTLASLRAEGLCDLVGHDILRLDGVDDLPQHTRIHASLIYLGARKSMVPALA
ncbi:MAG: hypothetical protein AAF376_05070 [Pseudomonadota bacterium]